MTQPAELSSAGLDPQRKRLLFRARHRGLRELDMLLGGFAEAQLAALSAAEADAFERLLHQPDTEVLAWLMGEAAAPQGIAGGLLEQVMAFCAGRRPLAQS